MLLEYFTEGTERTKTGSKIGMEVETDFLDEYGDPINIQTTRKLLSAEQEKPLGLSRKLELGRQKIEVCIQPQPTANLAIEAMQEALSWLYKQASQLGAVPSFTPETQWDGNLLWVQEDRDAIWVNLDGEAALEQLCRCSSVQFTVDVNPTDAINAINSLNAAKLQEVDYAPNHQRWLNYISQSRANYRVSRYGGPEWFDSFADYATQLQQHEVVMHKGQQVRAPLDQLKNPDIDLFLRSVWWHYRLRRYGDSLVVEIRPFARREDGTLPGLWKMIAEAIGI